MAAILLLYFVLLINVVLGVVGQLLLKRGVISVGAFHVSNALPFFWAVFSNIWVLLGLLFYGISVLLWVALISRVPLSVAYPMLSLGYVVVVIVSALYFGETVTALRLGGVALIVTGVVLIAL